MCFGLLQQPNGCEGLLAVGEDPDASDAAVSEVVHVPSIELHGNSAGPAAQVNPNEGKHAVCSHGFQALHVDAKVGTCVLDVAEKPPNAVRPRVGACQGGDLIVELYVVGAAGEVPVDVSLVYRRNSSLDDLDVLLRHRLLPQPHGFEG